MYIVTFYSFKGGTGRSMALVNTALELVKNGRKVLIVDFDLEAPGLDTFNLHRPLAPKGIVEFVHEYLETSRAPDVSGFVMSHLCPRQVDVCGSCQPVSPMTAMTRDSSR